MHYRVEEEKNMEQQNKELIDGIKKIRGLMRNAKGWLEHIKSFRNRYENVSKDLKKKISIVGKITQEINEEYLTFVENHDLKEGSLKNELLRMAVERSWDTYNVIKDTKGDEFKKNSMCAREFANRAIGMTDTVMDQICLDSSKTVNTKISMKR